MASDGIRVVLAKGALRGTISGASETVVTYATHLRRHGHEVSVLLVYPARRSNPYVRRLHRAGVPVVVAAPVDIEGAILAAAPLRRFDAVARPAGDMVRSLLQDLPDRYAVGCQRHLRRSGADVVHVVGQDASAGTVELEAHKSVDPLASHCARELEGDGDVLAELRCALRVAGQAAVAVRHVAGVEVEQRHLEAGVLDGGLDLVQSSPDGHQNSTPASRRQRRVRTARRSRLP